MSSTALSYGNSKKWIAPKVQEKQKNDRLNQARNKICRNSPFWPLNFDVETHKREFNILLQARLQVTVPSSPQTPPSVFSELTTSSTTSLHLTPRCLYPFLPFFSPLLNRSLTSISLSL
jgi:hypothetical protein